MDGHRKLWMRSRISWIAVLATLVIVPAASADHDRDDHDRWSNRYGNGYDGYGYGWDDPGRMYDRTGSWYGGGYWYASGYWPASGPYPEFASLDGYGRWQRVRGFDGPVWFPYVEASWRPYFYGYWINTRFGMTWVSYEPWGDIPHHYGHWVFVDHYGWGWVPGWDYGPAWVTWGVVDGYVGWAPLPPPGYRYPRACRYTPGHHHPDYRWSVSFAYDSSGLDFGLWVFVSDRDFYGSSIHNHALPPRTTLSLFKEKKVLPVGRDLSVDYVRKVSPSPVRKVDVVQRTKTTGGRTLTFQEPRGQESKVREGREMTKSVVRQEPERTGKGRVDWATDDRKVPVTQPQRGDVREKSRTGDTAVEKSPAQGKSRGETVVEKTPATGKSRDEAVVEKSPAKGKSRDEAVEQKSPAKGKSRGESAAPSKSKSTRSSKGAPDRKGKR